MKENTPRGAGGPRVRDLQRRPRVQGPPPDDFVPLKLLLQPSGWSVTLDRVDVIAGRHTSADIRLPLPDVSRQHCRFLWLEGDWEVVDLGSLNGIQVNGEPVGHAVLRDGDRLRIGGFTFRVERSRARRQEALAAGPQRLAS
jgi:pSer/pThr/pTyr-binding forkhead associated (FHA) protein